MKKMDLKRHSLLADKPDHFVIEGPDGGSFKVAKNALDPQTQKRIAALTKSARVDVQGFAEGGEVPYCPKCQISHPNCQCYSEGGEVESPDPEMEVEPPPHGKAMEISPDDPNREYLLKYLACGGEVTRFEEGGEVPPTSEAVLSQLAETAGQGAASFQTLPENYVPENMKGYNPSNDSSVMSNAWNALTKQIGSSPSAESLKKYGSVDEATKAESFGKSTPGGVGVQNVSLNTPQQQAVLENVTFAPETTPTTPSPKSPLSDSVSQMNKQAYEGMRAADEYSRSMQDAAKKIATIYTDSYKQMQAQNEHYNKLLGTLNTQAQDLMTEISAGKVNPNQYWENKSLPNRILSSIGILVSGLGANAYGGKNLAVEAINKSIDDDIESQKANISNKQNLLSKNLDITRNMTTAIEMTRAQLTAATAAQVAAVEAQNLGPQAKLKVTELKLDLLSKVSQGNQQIAKFEAMNRLRGIGGNPTQQDLALNPEMNDVAVTLPDGKIVMAFDKGRQEKATAAVIAHGEAKDLSRKMADLVDGGFTMPKTERDALAKSYISQGIGTIKDLLELGVLSGDDAIIAKNMLPSLGSFFNKNNKAVLEEFNSFIESKLYNRMKAYIPGYQPPPKPRKAK